MSPLWTEPILASLQYMSANTFSNVLLDFLHGVIIYLYFLYVLTPKWDKRWNALYLFLSAGIYTALANINNGVTKVFDGLPFLLRYIAILIYAIQVITVMVGFKEKLSKKLLQISVNIIMILIVDAFCSFVIFAIDPQSQINDANPYLFTFGKLLFAVILLPISILCGHMFKKKNYTLPLTHVFILLLFILVEFIMMANSIYVYNGHYSQTFFIWFAIELILSVVANILLLYLLQNAAQKQELEKKLTISQLNHMHTQQIEEDNEKLHMLRHDVKNLLATAEILLQQGNVQQAKQFLHDFHTEIDRQSNRAYCQNAVVNSVLQIKKQQAENTGFQLQADVFCPKDLAIDDVDLCTLFSNLLDNAIDHGDQRVNRVISISAWQNKADYVIRCQNGLAPNKRIYNRRKKNRGLGIGIIRKTVQKYDGTVDIQKDEQFTITLLLKMEDSIKQHE